MREILFRAKRLDNHEWVEGDLRQDNNLEEMYIRGWDYYTDAQGLQREPYEYQVDPTTLCQYTGFTDDDGNKVFEHDIIYIQDGQCCQGFWEFEETTEIKDIRGCDMLRLLCEETAHKKVIGNKFDNPELMESEQEGSEDEE